MKAYITKSLLKEFAKSQYDNDVNGLDNHLIVFKLPKDSNPRG